MNFSKRQNEYRGIPGFGASKGEPGIGKAFEKLRKRIQYLEECRISEKKSRSKASCNSKDEDLTLTDVQYQLLLLQLKYVRGLLRQNIHSNTEVFQGKLNKDEKIYTSPTTDKNITREDDLCPSIANKPASAEIYTVDNSTAKYSNSVEDMSKKVQVTYDNQIPKFRHPTEESTAVFQKKVPGSSKPHYHLKLDDVPFILGASATASHSVVANVQNIIARMKQHNKALCGPKPPVARSAFASTHSTDFIEKNSVGEKLKPNITKYTTANAHSTDFMDGNSAKEELKRNVTKSTLVNAHSTGFTVKNATGENSEDVTKLINELTRDLCVLAAKQKKMVESIDASQIKKHGPEVNSARNNQNDGPQINYKQVENDSSRTHRSYSESEVKLLAEVKKMPKVKEKDFIKHNFPPMQSACSIRSQPSNLSVLERRKLLRSLQKFKKNLSEEDISWD